MSETKKRKVHLPDFKAKVGLEGLRGVKTINEIAQDYGVHPYSFPFEKLQTPGAGPCASLP